MPASASSRTGLGSAGLRRAGLIAAQLGIVVALLLLWQFGVSEKNVPFFSRPLIVWDKIVELAVDPSFHRDIVVTLTEIAIGYGIGAGVGLTLGFTLGRSRLLSDLLEPFIIGLYSIPKIALAPLFIIWLGLGMAS